MIIKYGWWVNKIFINKILAIRILYYNLDVINWVDISESLSEKNPGSSWDEIIANILNNNWTSTMSEECSNSAYFSNYKAPLNTYLAKQESFLKNNKKILLI